MVASCCSGKFGRLIAPPHRSDHERGMSRRTVTSAPRARPKPGPGSPSKTTEHGRASCTDLTVMPLARHRAIVSVAPRTVVERIDGAAQAGVGDAAVVEVDGAGGGYVEDGLGDRLEAGAEVVHGLHHDVALGRRVDAHGGEGARA